MFPKKPIITWPVEMTGRPINALSEDAGVRRIWTRYRTSPVPPCGQPGKIVRFKEASLLTVAPGDYGITSIGDDYFAAVDEILRFDTNHEVFLRMLDGRYIRVSAGYAVDQSGHPVATSSGGYIGYTYMPPTDRSIVWSVSGVPVNDDLSLWSQVEDTASLSDIGIEDPATIVAMPYILGSAKIAYGGLDTEGQLATFTTKTSTPALTNAKRLLLWDADSEDVSWVLYVDTSNTCRLAGSSSFSGLDGMQVGMVATGILPDDLGAGHDYIGVIYTDTGGVVHAYGNQKNVTLSLATGEQVIALSDGYTNSPTIVTNLKTYGVRYNYYASYGDVGPYFFPGDPVTGPPEGVSQANFLGGNTYLDGQVLRHPVLVESFCQIPHEVQRLSDASDDYLSIAIDEAALEPWEGVLSPLDMCGYIRLTVDGFPGFYVGGVDYASDCDEASWEEVSFRSSSSLHVGELGSAVEYRGSKRGRYLLMLPYTSSAPVQG